MKINFKWAKNIVLSTCLICLSCSLIPRFAYSESRYIQYIETYSDYEIHTKYHIDNVSRLGMALFHLYKETMFSDVPEELIREKLRIHDYEKFASVDELLMMGYKHNRRFSERLFDVLGKHKSDPRHHREIHQIINELATIESYYNRRFLRKHNLVSERGELTNVAQKILMIEKIADVVERWMNPATTEELGMKTTEDASRYLKSAKEQVLAEQLAKIYHSVVPQHPLIALKSKITTQPTQAASCSQLFK